jgi:hypothetical protein
MISVVIGVGIIIFFLLAFSKIVDTTKHKHLRNLFLIMSFPLLFLIPTTLVLEQNICEPVVNSTAVAGNTTTYTYTDYCYEQSNGSGVLLRVTGVLVAIYFMYLIIWYGGEVIKSIKDVVRKN